MNVTADFNFAACALNLVCATCDVPAWQLRTHMQYKNILEHSRIDENFISFLVQISFCHTDKVGFVRF